jgi:hypothetical protein
VTAGEHLTDEERREALVQARTILARLWGTGLEFLPAADAGPCADCKRDVNVRLEYGQRQLALCRGCATSRRRSKKPPTQLREVA